MCIIHKIKKIYIFVFFVLISINTYCYAESKNLDIYAHLGYTKLNDFSFNRTKKIFTSFSGFNLGVSALYDFDNTAKVSPVLGANLSITGVANSNNTDVGTMDAKFRYSTLTANGGFKFHFFSLIPMYALANFGYAFSNSLDVTASNNSYASKVLEISSFNIKNHYFYGVTLMSSYKLGDMFSLGGGLVYNRHTMDLEYVTRPETTNERSSFNEYSANVNAMWSF